jgi:HD-GYP domain-containing protein (c-di-GMP phosphodiesterase class II)
MRRHVEHCLDILDEAQTVPDHIRDMIRGHHERDDGSGYPDGLAGDRIPLLARIAGVIDSYDAMISDRAHCKAIAKHAALQELYRQRDRLYAAEIVEQFMQCMSVYPTGSLVQLDTGEVAIVMGQNAARRLRPKVMVLTGPDKALLAQFRPFDLMMQAEGDGDAVQIACTLEPGAYGLDPTELFL